MTQPEENQPLPTPDVIEVADLDTFVAYMAAWHSERCALVQHFLGIPEDTVFEIGDKKLTLIGPALEGFRLGIEIAMMQLGTLPFAAEVEDEPVIN